MPGPWGPGPGPVGGLVPGLVPGASAPVWVCPVPAGPCPVPRSRSLPVRRPALRPVLRRPVRPAARWPPAWFPGPPPPAGVPGALPNETSRRRLRSGFRWSAQRNILTKALPAAPGLARGPRGAPQDRLGGGAAYRARHGGGSRCLHWQGRVLGRPTYGNGFMVAFVIKLLHSLRHVSSNVAFGEEFRTPELFSRPLPRAGGCGLSHPRRSAAVAAVTRLRSSASNGGLRHSLVGMALLFLF